MPGAQDGVTATGQTTVIYWRGTSGFEISDFIIANIYSENLFATKRTRVELDRYICNTRHRGRLWDNRNHRQNDDNR